MDFVKENKHYERLPLVYYELTAIYAGMYPHKPAYEPAPLLKKLEEYIALKTGTNESIYSQYGLVLKSKFLASLHRFKEATQIMNLPKCKNSFPSSTIFSLTKKVYLSVASSAIKDTKELLAEIKKERLLALRPDAYNQLLFLEKILLNNTKQFPTSPPPPQSKESH